MSLKWKDNAVINVKLKDDLFTLAQMHDRPYVQFFKISNRTGEWDISDLKDAACHLFVCPDRFFCREHFIEKLKK